MQCSGKIVSDPKCTIDDTTNAIYLSSLAALATNLSGVYSDKIKKVGNTFPQPNFSNGSPYIV